MITRIRIHLWKLLVKSYSSNLRRVYKMYIGKDVRISWKAHLDKSINPKGIHIGDGTCVINGGMILSHDACRSFKADTYIGRNCVIGVRSIIFPGIRIGDSSIVGAGGSFKGSFSSLYCCRKSCQGNSGRYNGGELKIVMDK